MDFYIKLESIAAAISACFTGCGVFLILPSLIYTAKQLRASKKLAEGEFLLRLDEMFRQHDEVHRRLRPGGDWGQSGQGPNNPKEWAEVESYMGLFERINVLIDGKIIAPDTINRLYGYRVTNIIANNKIRKTKLEEQASEWHDFIELAQKLKRY